MPVMAIMPLWGSTSTSTSAMVDAFDTVAADIAFAFSDEPATCMAMAAATTTPPPPPARASRTPLKREPLHVAIAVPADDEEDEAVLERFYQTLSPTSRRKRKNRDQMRRARQREKDTMGALRATVQRLEREHGRLTKAAALPGSQSTHLRGYRLLETHGCEQRREPVQPGDYAALMSLATHLNEENFQLKQELHEKNKLRETLERVVGDFVPHPMDEPPSWLLNDGEDLVDDGNQAPTPVQASVKTSPGSPLSGPQLSPMAVEAVIRRMHNEMCGLKKSALLSAATPVATCFGWQVRHRLQGEFLSLVFQKSFWHVSAYDTMCTMWENERSMRSYRNKAQAAFQTMKILQHVNDDTYVFQRQLLDPQTQRVLKTKYLRFRLHTEEGYLLGMTNVAPSDSNTAWAANICLGTEFVPRERGCEHSQGFTARVSLKINVDGTAATIQRNVADLMIGMFRWENEHVGPLFMLKDMGDRNEQLPSTMAMPVS